MYRSGVYYESGLYRISDALIGRVTVIEWVYCHDAIQFVRTPTVSLCTEGCAAFIGDWMWFSLLRKLGWWRPSVVGGWLPLRLSQWVLMRWVERWAQVRSPSWSTPPGSSQAAPSCR